MTEIKALDTLSTAELEALLEQRKKEEKAEAERKRKAYETRKDSLVNDLTDQALGLSWTLRKFKADAFNSLNAFYEAMKEYGDVSTANKGNFTLKSEDGTRKIEFSRQLNCGFDERANLAEEKLKDFLALTVKKRDQATYELVMSLLERNKFNNDFDHRNIQKLYKIEDKFDHPLWKDAIALFKESYQETGTSYYVRFYEADANGKMEAIQLNFASIPLPKAKAEAKEAA